MSDKYLGYVFDDEIFNETWGEEPDPVLNAMIQSGAVVQDGTIASMISDKGNIYTIPFYNVLDDSESDSNYDGQTDIQISASTSGSQTGVVFGRSKGWYRQNFITELSGSDPMNHIAKSVARWWQKKNQKRLIQLLDTVFAVPGDAEWRKHISNFASMSASVSEANKLSIATGRDVLVKANGDNADIYSLAIMHSAVANNLAKLGQIEFWKQNDGNGIEKPLRIGSYNGLTVIIDDSVPTKASTAAVGETEYTTYLLGNGFIRTADGKLEYPSEVNRDAKKNGGQDELYTRIRRTYHPNGFSFKIPTTGWTESPTDAQLFNPDNWELKFPAKSIPAVKVVTNG